MTSHLQSNHLIRLLFIILFMISVPFFASFIHLEFKYLVEPMGQYSLTERKMNQPLLLGLFIFTETVSFPYGVLTALLLTLFLAKCLKVTLRQTIILLGIVCFAVILGLLIKSGIKLLTSEPRPYMVWLFSLVNDPKYDLFQYYLLEDKAEKVSMLADVMRQPVIESWKIPNWLSDHWIQDKEYRFPSGHTFFAAFFALIFAGLLPNRLSLISWFLALWAALVMWSRLMLGMHVPIDLAGGMLIAIVSAMPVVYVTRKYLL